RQAGVTISEHASPSGAEILNYGNPGLTAGATQCRASGANSHVRRPHRNHCRLICSTTQIFQVLHLLSGKPFSGAARRMLGSAFAFMSTVSPRRNFAVPAAAIIAALSVVKIGRG